MIFIDQLRKDFVIGWPHRRIIRAVRGLTFEIHPGEIFGLLGPNGAGKTTTIKLICGLLHPSGGSIAINNVLCTRRHPQRKLLGAVLEGNRNVYWNLSVWENLMYFARTRGVSSRVAKERAENLLNTFTLLEKRRDSVGSLSRGMQQKLALCCAMLPNPPILLVDEPTLGLDLLAAQTIRTQLRSLAANDRKTILLTTHDMQLASDICDRIGIMRTGELVRLGPVEDYRTTFNQVETSFYLESEPGPPLLQDLEPLGTRYIENPSGSPPFELTLVSHGSLSTHHLEEIGKTLRRHEIALRGIRTHEATLEQAFLKLIGEDRP